MQAAEMLAANTDNPYLVDASGYLRRAAVEAAHSGYQGPHDELITNTMQQVGDHAILAGDEPLADHAFEHANWGERWRLYGKASVSGAIDDVSDWSLALESTESQNEIDTNKIARAEMRLAEMQIQLAEYSTSTEWMAARQAWDKAIALKEDAKSELRIGESDRFETVPLHRPIPYDPIVTSTYFNGQVDALFAAHGVWSEVEMDWAHYPYSDVKGGNRTIAKAAVGELNGLDKMRLRKRWTVHSALIAVNDAVNGEGEVEPFSEYSLDNKLDGSGVLVAAAPKAVVELNLVGRWHPDLLLEYGNPEDVAGMYSHMQEYANYRQLIWTALSMARHHEDMQAASAAHDVYNAAHREKIQLLQDYTRTQDWESQPGEAAAVLPLLQEVTKESYGLKDPVHHLLAVADQLRISLDVDPASDDAHTNMYHLKSAWLTLERIDSYADILPDVARALQARGIQFRRQWKHASHDTGYVGLAPVVAELRPRASANTHQQNEREEGQWLEGYQVQDWLASAEKLNEIHGEERYKVILTGETKNGEGEHRYQLYQRVKLEGTWRELDTDRWEFVASHGVARRGKGTLDTLPWLTERIAALDIPLLDDSEG